jgi:hypothetical protein
MITESYLEQLSKWPAKGRRIMAQFDDESIVVYQAYRQDIADFAVKHQRFGGEFSYTRMSWIKPNFLWMMYRSGWGAKEGQERILAIRLRRQFFDELLQLVVPSTFDSDRYATHEEWKSALTQSSVRLQWDPDHDPSGSAVERRAVQLGVRGEILRRYGEREILCIDDITQFVIEQRANLVDGYQNLKIPRERVYTPFAVTAARAVGIDQETSAQSRCCTVKLSLY